MSDIERAVYEGMAAAAAYDHKAQLRREARQREEHSQHTPWQAGTCDFPVSPDLIAKRIQEYGRDSNFKASHVSVMLPITA